MATAPWQLWSDDLTDIHQAVLAARRPQKPANVARENGTAPRNDVERELARIFGELLGVDRVAVDDDFFRLGGHSLLATQVIARVRTTFAVDAPLEWIIDAPTVERMARKVEEARRQGKKQAEVAEPLPAVIADPAHALETFALTDIQQAYWVGRSQAFELGGLATHIYLEFERAGLDVAKLERAWQRLVVRHDMLRMVVDLEGRQRILPEVPPPRIEVEDLSGATEDARKQRLEALRYEMSHELLDITRGPLIHIRATRLPGGVVRTHFSVDFLCVDAGSLGILFREWEQLYVDADATLPQLQLTFRDYVTAAEKVRHTQQHRRSQDYWWKRVGELPGGPLLPLAKSPKNVRGHRFVRRTQRLDEAQWARLKKRAAAMEVTPSTLLATAFGEVLGTWSRTPHFLLNLTLFNRLPLHPGANDVVGDFTSLTLLELDLRTPGTFEARAKRAQKQLWADLDHRYVSGVEVAREMGRRQEAVVTMPVVFTSTLGMSLPLSGESSLLGKEVFAVSQTPQVWLDHHVFEEAGGALRFSWDAVEELFPPDLLDDMLNAYRGRLERLIAGDERDALLVPAKQLEAFTRWNATDAPVPTGLLHAPLLEQARKRPDATAVIAPGRSLSYRELTSEATRLARRLRELGVKPNELVAVVMARGWEQMVAVVAVLQSGGAYVPIDADLPRERRFHLLERCGVRVVLTQPRVDAAGPWPEGVERVRVEAGGLPGASDAPLAPVQSETDLAYVIFTSGSTGMPKGVMIEHRGALNTVVDINERHAITPSDRVLSISSLSFDLSVYDVFGMLGAGGTVVQIASADTREPGRWVEAIQSHRITVWNSVPALMQMMLNFQEGRDRAALKTLRLAMWSGDWVPVGLADELRSQVDGVRVISMGGATEASIWSIDYPIEKVDPSWPSIPYGKPMKNQSWHVLGEGLAPRPVWVPGELFIGGVGLARGYWRDEEKTNERFVVHPQTRERLYRTGDWGRYLADGNIEFLGRVDGQVKIRGFRVELGEIDAALCSLPEVREAVASTYADASGQKSLAAYVVLKEGAALDDAAVRNQLGSKLPDYMVPAQVLFLPAMPLSSNGKVDRKALPSPVAATARTDHVAPRNERERKMATLWAELLEKERVGVTDNFFSLGGNSLIAVSVAARARRELGVDVPLGKMLEHPTIEKLLGSLEDASAKPRLRHLVTLAPGADRPPLVLVSGLGGYAFVFQGLAKFLDARQPMHVLNAIGAQDEGEGIGHSIEAMAAIYEPQILAVAAQGPVVVGGYSFGMLVAFEIARRLQRAGRKVPLLVSFDGFAPTFPELLPLPLRLVEHAKTFLSADGPGRRAYVRDRFRALRSRVYHRLGRPEESIAAIPNADPETDRRLRRVSAALWQAGLRYKPDYVAPSDLFLIKTSISERWIGNRMEDPLYGWKSWVTGKIDVITVPGEHLTLFEEANQHRIADAVSQAIAALAPGTRPLP